MKMCPDAEPDDGLLDVVTIGDITKRDLVLTMPKIYRGTHLPHPKAEVLRGPRDHGRDGRADAGPARRRAAGHDAGTLRGAARGAAAAGAGGSEQLSVPAELALVEARRQRRRQAARRRLRLLRPLERSDLLLERGDALLERVDPAYVLAELVDRVRRSLRVLRACVPPGSSASRGASPRPCPRAVRSRRRLCGLRCFCAMAPVIPPRRAAGGTPGYCARCRTDSGSPTTSACGSPRPTRRASPITRRSSSGSRRRASRTWRTTPAGTARSRRRGRGADDGCRRRLSRRRGLRRRPDDGRAAPRSAAPASATSTVERDGESWRPPRPTMRPSTRDAPADAGSRRGSWRRSLGPSRESSPSERLVGGRRHGGIRRRRSSSDRLRLGLRRLRPASWAAPWSRPAPWSARRRSTTATCSRRGAPRRRRRRGAARSSRAAARRTRPTTRLPFASSGRRCRSIGTCPVTVERRRSCSRRGGAAACRRGSR